jgi:hypothetical protein
MGQYSTLQATTPQGKYTNLSASGIVATGPGVLVGVVINSHSSGTLKFWDNTSAATTVINNTMTLAAGERWIPLFGEKFTVGCYLTIGGTADVTVITN